jgi:hypothetical protein
MFNNKLLFFGKDTKLTIPLDDVSSLEKRINALVFDNSIAVITKNEKETFFTSFLMRDRAFEAIKDTIAKNDKSTGKNAHNQNMLKRTFIRFRSESNNGNEGEESEDESEDEDQGSYVINQPNGEEGARISSVNQQERPDPEAGDDAGESQAPFDLRVKENLAILEEI